MRNSKDIHKCRTNHEYVKNSFFSRDYKRIVGSHTRSSGSPNNLKSKVLKFIWPKANSFFNCLNPKGVKFITRLRLGLSHPGDQKLKHSFEECVNLCVPVVLKSKQLLIICLVVPTTYMKEKPFWTTWNLYFLIFWNKVTLLLIMFFSLGIPL